MCRALSLVAILALASTFPAAQAGTSADVRYDQLLDLNVRDGLVYYRALKSDRGRLDRYVASLDVPDSTYASWARPDQLAFWINAYNAIVLQAVIDRYPIRGSSGNYPSNSIRQIAGVFERTKHRVAGRSLTLDDIEKTVLPEFKDPRVSLALGRGAIGSGRLRSEAYSGERLEQQLADVQQEFVNEQSMLKIDRSAGEVAVTPIVSWHEAEFVAAYDKGPTGSFAARSPVERAIVAFIAPNLLPLERDFINRNEFKVTFQPFDWRLNDLTGGRPQ